MPAYSKEKSKIKLFGLTGPTEENITLYSFISLNHKPSMEIIEGMLKRFEKTPAYKRCKIIQFYENGQLIKEYR